MTAAEPPAEVVRITRDQIAAWQFNSADSSIYDAEARAFLAKIIPWIQANVLDDLARQIEKLETWTLAVAYRRGYEAACNDAAVAARGAATVIRAGCRPDSGGAPTS